MAITTTTQREELRERKKPQHSVTICESHVATHALRQESLIDKHIHTHTHTRRDTDTPTQHRSTDRTRSLAHTRPLYLSALGRVHNTDCVRMSELQSQVCCSD